MDLATGGAQHWERGVTEFPGPYAVGPRWPHSEPSSVVAGVGLDAEHIVRLITHNSSTMTANR